MAAKTRPKVHPSIAPLSVIVSPISVAQMIAMRLSGMTRRAIAVELALEYDLVCTTLRRPEIRAQLILDANKATEKWRKYAVDLVPEAMRVVENHLDNDDLEAAKMILQGTQTLQNKSELEVTTKGPLDDLDAAALLYTVKHGHLPTEPCTCEADFVAQSAPMLVAENVPDKDPDKP